MRLIAVILFGVLSMASAAGPDRPSTLLRLRDLCLKAKQGIVTLFRDQDTTTPFDLNAAGHAELSAWLSTHATSESVAHRMVTHHDTLAPYVYLSDMDPGTRATLFTFANGKEPLEFLLDRRLKNLGYPGIAKSPIFRKLVTEMSFVPRAQLLSRVEARIAEAKSLSFEERQAHLKDWESRVEVAQIEEALHAVPAYYQLILSDDGKSLKGHGFEYPVLYRNPKTGMALVRIPKEKIWFSEPSQHLKDKDFRTKQVNGSIFPSGVVVVDTVHDWARVRVHWHEFNFVDVAIRSKPDGKFFSQTDYEELRSRFPHQNYLFHQRLATDEKYRHWVLEHAPKNPEKVMMALQFREFEGVFGATPDVVKPIVRP